MRATVAEPQVRGREAQDERSGRQIRDHRKTNWQRGRVWAASVLANAKPKAHQDAPSRARWRAEKVQVLTRGDLPAERRGEVSRGHSSAENCRKAVGAKGQSTSDMAQSRVLAPSERSLKIGRSGNYGSFRAIHAKAEPVQPGRAFAGETKWRAGSREERKP
jgi:hypothetical protein